MEKNKLDVYSRMNKQMIEIIKLQEERSKGAFDTVEDFNQMREAYNKERVFWNEGGPVMIKTLDETIEGPHGDIPIRFHYPNNNAVNKCIVFTHGGGWVVGNLNTHDRIMRILADKTDAVVVGIDYKLSPEYKFPVPMEECAALTRYLRSNSEKYGIDANNISFAGDSGGAYLAFATALYLRDNEEDTSYLKTLLLYYGAFGLKDSASMRLHGSALDGLTRKDLEYYNNIAINLEDQNSPYFDCLSSDVTYGIPATYLAVSDIDPLLDDSLVLHSILTEHGTICECDIYKGVLHAFMHYSKMLDAANEAFEKSAAFFIKHS